MSQLLPPTQKKGAKIWTNETSGPKDEEVVDFKKSLQPTDNLSGDEPKIIQVVHEFSDTNFVGASGGQSATSATIPKRRWQQNAGKGIALLGERDVQIHEICGSLVSTHRIHGTGKFGPTCH